MREDEALAANEAFYRAFDDGDREAMRRLWAERAPVVCVHPGGAAIVGREAVLASWDAILGAPTRPAIVCLSPNALCYDGFALVSCVERLSGGVLVATNGFVLEDGAWRMALHQAGPAPAGR